MSIHRPTDRAGSAARATISLPILARLPDVNSMSSEYRASQTDCEPELAAADPGERSDGDATYVDRKAEDKAKPVAARTSSMWSWPEGLKSLKRQYLLTTGAVLVVILFAFWLFRRPSGDEPASSQHWPALADQYGTPGQAPDSRGAAAQESQPQAPSQARAPSQPQTPSQARAPSQVNNGYVTPAPETAAPPPVIRPLPATIPLDAPGNTPSTEQNATGQPGMANLNGNIVTPAAHLFTEPTKTGAYERP